MLAKLTAKNQLTLPKAVTAAVGPAEYFEVETRGGQIILTPVRLQRADAVRVKLAELELSTSPTPWPGPGRRREAPSAGGSRYESSSLIPRLSGGHARRSA